MLQCLKEEFQEYSTQSSQCLMALSYLCANILSDVMDFLMDSGATLEISAYSQNLPLGAGLGSSAAFSVALSGALLKLRVNSIKEIYLQQEISTMIFESSSSSSSSSSSASHFRPTAEMLQEINTWAFISEVIIHGEPSGLDNYTSCYGAPSNIVNSRVILSK